MVVVVVVVFIRSLSTYTSLSLSFVQNQLKKTLVPKENFIFIPDSSITVLKCLGGKSLQCFPVIFFPRKKSSSLSKNILISILWIHFIIQIVLVDRLPDRLSYYTNTWKNELCGFRRVSVCCYITFYLSRFFFSLYRITFILHFPKEYFRLFFFLA